MSEKRKVAIKTPYSPDRRPIHVIYPRQPKCPTCGLELANISVRAHHFPYTHSDNAFYCEICDETYTFGIPSFKDAGLALIVFDSNPVEAVKFFGTLEDPKCPWKHGKMLKTKIFGDWTGSDWDDVVEYQHKCPTCFLVRHQQHKRAYPHGEIMPLTEEEQEILKNRLRQMGYIEEKEKT